MKKPAIVTYRKGIQYRIVEHSSMRHVPAIRRAAIEVASFAEFTLRHPCQSNYEGLVNRIREFDEVCEPLTLKSRSR